MFTGIQRDPWGGHLRVQQSFFLGNFLLLAADKGKVLILLHVVNLDVAGTTHVRIDPTVGPVCSTPHLGSTVNLKLIVNKCSNLKFVMTNLDVLDDKVVGIQSLVLSIALSVLQQMKEEFS